MRVVLLGFGGREGVLAAAERLQPEIEKRARIVARDFTGRDDLSQVDSDYAIVFGGDGSILRAVHQMGRRQVPVIAVNLGRLGFLADLSPDELPSLLDRLRQGPVEVVEHLLLCCQVTRGGDLIHEELGLNEVAVQNGAPFAIMDVDLYVDSELVTTYSCDGLILATPIGSTAHSLSAGGPILRKDLRAVVISPISPHTLTHRPVVDSAERVYDLVVPKPLPQTSVVVDGRVICTLGVRDRVRVRRAEVSFPLVTAPGHSYYRTLREKLGWSGRFTLGDRK